MSDIENWWNSIGGWADTASDVTSSFGPMVNLGNSSTASDYSDLYDTFTRALPVGAVFSDETSSPSWIAFLGETLQPYSQFFKENEPLMKWGGSALGGLAGYLSARQYNKLAKQQRDALMAERAKKQAQAAALGAPRNYTLTRALAPSPSGGRGEAQYFTNNALSANPSVVQMAEGGAPKRREASPLSRVPSREELEEMLAQQRAIEQLMLQQADRYQRGTDEAPTAAEARLMDSVPRLGGYAGGGYAAGGTKGQDDKIPAMLSDGEFVMDAETVSMLGDGNNAAGASALEQLRRNVRKQKRGAPVDKIPSKAKKPEQYLKKGKK